MLHVAENRPAILDGFGAETWFDKYYCRADVTSLFGGVSGHRLLDAGCGYGADAWALEASDAVVTGLDIDCTALQFARHKGRSNSISFIQADLRLNIPLRDEAYDGVLASLVLHYLEDWKVPLQEFSRILSTHGRLIISVHHPAADSQDASSENYYSRESWKGIDDFGGEHIFWRRPLEEMLGEVQRFGFAIEKLVEPKPVQNAFYASRQDYEKLISTPRYLVICAIKK